MRNVYRRRPEDFKRRIVQRVTSSRRDLLEIEHKWLSQIKDEQLGKKFYNMSKKRFGHWSCDEQLRDQVSKKLIGRKHSEETKKLISDKKKGKKSVPCSEEKKKKISIANKGKKGQWNKGGTGHAPWNKGLTGGTSWNKGKKLSPEHRAKLSEAKRKKNDHYITGIPKAITDEQPPLKVQAESDR
jgi:hypothetical protein